MLQWRRLLFFTSSWAEDVLTRQSPAVMLHRVLCQESVVCFFPVCCKKATPCQLSMLNGSRGTLLDSLEETPSIESTEAECVGLNKTGAKGFVSGSLPSGSPRVPGNQVRLLEPACREETTQNPLYFSADVQRHGSLWEQRWLWFYGGLLQMWGEFSHLLYKWSKFFLLFQLSIKASLIFFIWKELVFTLFLVIHYKSLFEAIQSPQ